MKPRANHRSILLAAIFLFSQAAPGFADADDALQFFAEEAHVMAASKNLESVSGTPATSIVISRDDIRKRGYSYLKDVLRDLPGMETIEFSFSEDGTLVPVRGITGNNKILFLVNGMRVNPPGGEDMPLRSDFSVKNAEQIEVIYGPGSTLYGQDAISAIINVVTQKPSERASANLQAAVGTNRLREGYVSASAKNENAGVLVSAHGMQSNLTNFRSEYPGWWENTRVVAEPKGTGTTPTRWDKGQNLFARVESEQNSIQVWSRESSRSSAEGGYVPVLHFVGEAIWRDKLLAAEAKNKVLITDDVNLESSLTYSKYEIDPQSRYVFPANTTSYFYNDYKYGVGTGVNLEEKVSARVSERVLLTGGVITSNFDILPKATIPGGAQRDRDITSQGGTFTYYTRLGDPTSRVDVQRANNLLYQSYGAYLESHLKLTTSLNAVIGGRFDKDSRYKTTPISPRLAAIYSLNRATVIKYIFSKAFVAPAPYFAYNTYDNGVSLNTSNPNLEPERSRSHEVNLTYQENQWLMSLSGYVTNQENLIIVGDRSLPANIVANQVFLDLAGTQTRSLTHSVNAGKSQARGFDFYNRLKVGNASLWGSYSYVNFRSNVDGVKSGLDQLSAHNVRFGLTYNALSKLYVTPSAIWRSTPQNVIDKRNLDSEIRNPFEVNLHVVYTTTSHLDLFVGARNLTNHHYALKGVLNPVPQETRQFNAGASYTF